MARAWMPMYWGDYLRDTADLSLVEHGAYVKLLSTYYSTGKPLPANAKQLLRICSAFDEAEQVAMQVVLDRFFTKEGGVYRNKRADAEIAKAVEVSEKRAEAGALGGRAKALANALANATTTTTTATTTDKDLPPNGGRSAPPPYADIIAAYHAELPMCPQVRELTDKRKTQIRQRWRENPERQSLDWWTRYFAYVRKCPFLIGQVEAKDRKPFLADLEWLTKAGNLVKVIEGRYEA